MATNKITLSGWLQTSVLRLARIHFALIGIVAVQIIVFDSWQLITPNIVLQRWIALSLLLTAVTIVWLLAHNRQNDANFFKRLVLLLILADVAFASYNVYLQRGMASRAVFLYAIPIIVSSVLLSRVAIFATATICATAYLVTTVAYFVLNFNEGYRVELYGEVGFYMACFFVLAALLSAFVKFKDQ